MTSLENKVARLINEVCPWVELVPQYKAPGVLTRRGRPFVFDFWVKDTNVLVECDGVSWHSAPQKQRRDSVKNNEAVYNGYVVIRFVNGELSYAAIKKFGEYLAQRYPKLYASNKKAGVC